MTLNTHTTGATASTSSHVPTNTAAGIEFDAMLTSEQVEQAERLHAEYHRTRRTALLFLTKSKRELIVIAHGDGGLDLVAECAESIADYVKHLKGLAELAESALARLIVVAEAVEGGAS